MVLVPFFILKRITPDEVFTEDIIFLKKILIFICYSVNNLGGIKRSPTSFPKCHTITSEFSYSERLSKEPF